MARAKVAIVHPQGRCDYCPIQHPKRFNATVLSRGENDLLFPRTFQYYVHNEVLLSTAQVLIQDLSGNYAECRAVLDSGSQVSFISHACTVRLNLCKRVTHIHVDGVAAANVDIKHFVRISIRSRHDPLFSCETEAYVVPLVTGDLPIISFTDSMHMWPHLNLLSLADPGYNLSRGIDLLLGADCFPYIMHSELRIGTPAQPMAQATVFGWVLLGPVMLKVQQSQQLEEADQAEENNGNGRVDENPGSVSSSSSWIKCFDLCKHCQLDRCCFTKVSPSTSSHDRQLQEHLKIDSV